MYLYRGDIHIIPLEQDDDKDLSVMEALEQVRQQPHKTRASQEIQNSIHSRIEGWENILMIWVNF